MSPEMDHLDDGQRVRRWRLPGSALVGVVEPRGEAVVAIETVARESEVHGEANRAALLREALTTLRAACDQMPPDGANWSAVRHPHLPALQIPQRACAVLPSQPGSSRLPVVSPLLHARFGGYPALVAVELAASRLGPNSWAWATHGMQCPLFQKDRSSRSRSSDYVGDA
jgi:hypothetical protein